MPEGAKPYHHGNLRRALLDEALIVIAERGPVALSLRELSRRLDVSHAAPSHHFEDKAALLTAIAAEGYEILAAALESAAEGTFLDVGLAYVRFALHHHAHLQVMFQPSLYREDDSAVDAGRSRANAVLYRSAGNVPPAGSNPTAIGLAGWCLMHGFSSLWLTGNIRSLGNDPIEAAKVVAAAAFAGRGRN